MAGESKCRNALDSRLFFFGREENMLVRYKKNKKPACYDSDVLVTTGRYRQLNGLRDHLKAAETALPSHGFICYSSEEIALEPICRK